MIGVMVEDGEGAIELFDQNYAGKFVGEGELSQRESEMGLAAGGFAEAVTASDGEDQWHCLVRIEKGGEFFGGKLLAAGVEQNEVVLLMALAGGERQDCGFIFE